MSTPEDKAIVPVEQPEIRLGVLQANKPADVISRATEVATQLAKIVKDRRLTSRISGREYVQVEGWSTMGAMIGVLPREVETTEHENGDFESTVELIRASDGAVIGRGSALVGADEKTWGSRPRYARRSMAITRATGKAYRLGFSWIMSLAGYAPTPAEEMDGVIEGEVVEESDPIKKAENTKTASGSRLGDMETDKLKQFRALVDTLRGEKKAIKPTDEAAYAAAGILIEHREKPSA